MKNKLTVILFMFNVCFLTTAFEVTLKDSSLGYGWKLSKARPFHYFNSTNEIDEGFLPVHVESLPDGDGIWILRYKDFSHLPRQFASNDGDLSKSFIKYSSKALLFSKVTLKVLNVGDVQLELALGSTLDTQKIALSAIKNCSKLDESTSPKGQFKWTTYEIHTVSPSANMAVEVLISHPESFFILDEINVTHSQSEDKPFDVDYEDGNFRVICKSLN